MYSPVPATKNDSSENVRNAEVEKLHYSMASRDSQKCFLQAEGIVCSKEMQENIRLNSYSQMP